MNSKELHKTLAQYIGLRVRISSDATSSNTLWRDSYPELVEVIPRETDDAVCCKTSDGVWSIVIPEGLTIEVEPAIGTHDFAEPAKQMELIGAARKAYDEAETTPLKPKGRNPKKLDWADW